MALPDYVFTEGWDKYGPVNTSIWDTYNVALTVDEWRSIGGGDTHYIEVPLSGTVTGHGSYRQKASNSGNSPAQDLKSLPANYARVVGGFTFKAVDSFSQNGLTFVDVAAGVNQLTIQLNMSSGHIEIRRGWRGGTLMATSLESWSVNTVHVLEYDITFHASAGIVKIWLDGVATSINLTGQNTISNANPYFNGIDLGTINSNNHAAQWDHFYLWAFTASGGSETPCLDNPIIETASASGDNAVAWTINGHAFLSPNYYWGRFLSSISPGGNIVYLVKCVADAAGTISAVNIMRPNTTSAIAKHKAVIYADSSGSPAALLATGTEVVGVTAQTPLTLPITLAGVTAGQTLWVGWITDTSINYVGNDDGGICWRKANTYTSGPPSPADSGFTTNSTNVGLMIQMTGVTTHWTQESNQPSPQNNGYNVSGTVGQQDIYTFPPLVNTPTAIHSVSVKGNVAKSDSGLRTIKFLCKSGAVVNYGQNINIAPPTSWGMEGSFWSVDPNTSAAWAAAALNAAKFGLEITS
jgi:hypothetical protein